MLDDESSETPTTPSGDETPAPRARRTRAAARATSGPTTAADAGAAGGDEAPAAPRRRRTTKATSEPRPEVETTAEASAEEPATASPRKRTRRKAAAVEDTDAAARAAGDETPLPALTTAAQERSGVPVVLFQQPDADAAPPRPRRAKKAAAAEEQPATAEAAETGEAGEPGEGEERPASRRRRGRRGRGRGAGGTGEAGEQASEAGDQATADGATEGEPEGVDEDAVEGETPQEAAARRRRRRRRRRGGGDDAAETVDEDGVETVVHVRAPRSKSADAAARTKADDSVRGVTGSTRLEAKRQRRREGRETGRRRPPIITEAEFLARREAVERVMVVRQVDDRTQIAVLEDGILVEHYVARKDHTSMVGNVYLGKVQNVLPSMEAAFVDIGRGRNAVLYAGEVNYDASALEGRPPRIEQALKSGQSVLVQVTKDPIGHKGARLTSQVSLPGRYMVYVPDGRLSGISRKLPDTERSRLKGILKRLTPEDAGVIIRTAAEGASEEELERDLKRLHAQWQDIDKKSATASAPALIYGEPDVVIRVIRDIFNEDFKELVVQGADEWETVDNYIRWVAPDLADRTRKWTDAEDIFSAYRVDEQLAKALDRKVWLPSGGYLVIDRTEAMIVVDVNTGKFTGKGGNLEETVTKNNLEAAEEIVRQLRLRDLGGIIVIDFIDMVLESNRDLVLRRLMECLGRDRTRHQVAEVTSLGLVQMTRKRVGQGLLEAFSEPCKECGGRGVKLTLDPVADKRPKPAGDGNGNSKAAAAKPEAEKPTEKPTEKSATEKPAARSRGGRGRASRPAGPPEPATPADAERPATTEPADSAEPVAEHAAAGS